LRAAVRSLFPDGLPVGMLMGAIVGVEFALRRSFGIRGVGRVEVASIARWCVVRTGTGEKGRS